MRDRTVRFGKTTFLRCLALLEQPSEGQVVMEGNVISAAETTREIKRAARAARPSTEPGLETVRRQLRAEMETLLRADEDPRVLGRGEIFEAYKYMGSRKHAYETWLKFRQ